MTIGTALSIYLIGIIFLTIGIGVWARINSKLIDELDTIFFCTIIVSWPIGLCFATLYFSFFFFLVKPIGLLMLKSGDCCDGIVNWWKSMKKKKQYSNVKKNGV